MVQFPQLSDNHFNNPSKEILAGSGLYEPSSFGPRGANGFFAVDRPNSSIPNTGIFTRSSTTTTTPNPQDHALLNNSGVSNASMHTIDDMNVINNYVHYYANKQFNPASFLVQQNIQFNLYSKAYR